MTRQQLRLGFSNFDELTFEGLGNASMKGTSGLAQQGAVGRILHQRMFEQVSRVRWHALPKQQSSLGKAAQRRQQFRFRLTRHCR